MYLLSRKNVYALSKGNMSFQIDIIINSHDYTL